jgi:hypothetical protein
MGSTCKQLLQQEKVTFETLSNPGTLNIVLVNSLDTGKPVFVIARDSVFLFSESKEITALLTKK